jgi:hypothetical protein
VQVVLRNRIESFIGCVKQGSDVDGDLCLADRDDVAVAQFRRGVIGAAGMRREFQELLTDGRAAVNRGGHVRGNCDVGFQRKHRTNTGFGDVDRFDAADLAAAVVHHRRRVQPARGGQIDLHRVSANPQQRRHFDEAERHHYEG